jgi:hypothetical protein
MYTNEILGLTKEGASWIPLTEVILVKKEVQGTIDDVPMQFLDYSMVDANGVGGKYYYGRGDKFGKLPSPAYLPDSPEDALGSCEPGVNCTDGLFEILDTTDPEHIEWEVTHPYIFPKVFESVDHQTTLGEEAVSFATAADDTRAVINHMHSFAVPADFIKKPPCTGVLEVSACDLGLEGVSGFHVPERIKAGAEGREMSVTVTNHANVEAHGTWLFIQAKVVPEDDPDGLGTPEVTWFTVDSAGDGLEETTENHEVTFPLDANGVKTFSGFVPGWLTADHKNGHIEWEALILVPCDYNPANNVATRLTTIIGGQGSGGGGNHMLRG